jgi:MoaA/NifB/PqqE/SkfB family radical SAM enzyme
MALPLAATWELALLCNYRCPYCFIPWHDNAIGVLHQEITPDDWETFWNRMFRLYGGFHITVAGGEPFVYAGFIDLLESVAKVHRVSVNTNLSWDPKNILGRVADDKFSISASFHPHFEKIDPFLQKVKVLKDYGYKVIATVVAYPPLFEQLAGFRDAFQNSGIGFYFQPFQGKIGSKNYPQDYTSEERLFLFGESAMKEDVMNIPMKNESPYGRPCAAGQKRFRVTADGLVIRCAQSWMLHEKAIGHIKNPNLRLLDGPAPCPARQCFCPEEFSYLVDLGIDDILNVGTVPARKAG